MWGLIPSIVIYHQIVKHLLPDCSSRVHQLKQFTDPSSRHDFVNSRRDQFFSCKLVGDWKKEPKAYIVQPQECSHQVATGICQWLTSTDGTREFHIILTRNPNALRCASWKLIEGKCAVFPKISFLIFV